MSALRATCGRRSGRRDDRVRDSLRPCPGSRGEASRPRRRRHRFSSLSINSCRSSMRSSSTSRRSSSPGSRTSPSQTRLRSSPSPITTFAYPGSLEWTADSPDLRIGFVGRPALVCAGCRWSMEHHPDPVDCPDARRRRLVTWSGSIDPATASTSPTRHMRRRSRPVFRRTNTGSRSTSTGASWAAPSRRHGADARCGCA